MSGALENNIPRQLLLELENQESFLTKELAEVAIKGNTKKQYSLGQKPWIEFLKD